MLYHMREYNSEIKVKNVVKNWRLYMTSYRDREEIRKKFPKGTKVKAVLYDLRHEGIYDPQVCEIIGCISEKNIEDGCRFGVKVKYNGKKYWVDPDDVEVYR